MQQKPTSLDARLRTIGAALLSSLRPPREGIGNRLAIPLSLLLGLLGTLPGVGCYYGHLATGQARLIAGREPVAALLEDPKTPDRLREQLELTLETRSFARSLGLDVGKRYTSYVAWPGDRIVTTVVATRPGEVEPMGFRFPIVGRVPYKGFFEQALAEREAARLRAEGMDVCVLAVSAYSTLGWFDDPLTQPMLKRSDSELVQTLLHELVHATVFVASAPDFNEGAARFIGQEAAIRFFATRTSPGTPQADDDPRASVEEDRLLADALLDFRSRVADLYASEPPSVGRSQQRAALEGEMRAELAALPLFRRDAARLAETIRLNDACLAVRGTYAVNQHRFAGVLEREGGDVRRLIERLLQSAEADDPEAAFFADEARAQ